MKNITVSRFACHCCDKTSIKTNFRKARVSFSLGKADPLGASAGAQGRPRAGGRHSAHWLAPGLVAPSLSYSPQARLPKGWHCP